MTTLPDSAFPDGIEPRHTRPGAMGWRFLPLLLLGALLALALSGALGGRPNPVVTARSPAVDLAFKAPTILRNGEFFEMRVTATARRPIARPVLAVSATYLHDLTINSFIPAASKEGFEDGMFVFEFEPLPAGKALEIKLDGQVNPPLVGVNAGTLQLRDGDRALATLRSQLRVLP
ncbi:hypothetical protein [Alteraurantiacibacter buctensis]|uniref:Uncharacterized protein n=1 Tax=Alteraurantiacibacter buctensis TaxID=1503981 RepID=A0A844YUV8_9SPHN|nr:hypothetical protein [Alteraurantiacibacter buctensis]MXO70806.1 hypothetical protein [Alteraurantiacibacter buctensis]